MRLDVFLNSSTKLIAFRHFKLNLALKIEFLMEIMFRQA